MGELDPQHPGRSRKVSPGRAKGDSPDQGPDPTTSAVGDMTMPFSKEMTHGTTPEPECHVCRAGLTSADRSGIRNVRQAVGPYLVQKESR